VNGRLVNDDLVNDKLTPYELGEVIIENDTVNADDRAIRSPPEFVEAHSVHQAKIDTLDIYRCLENA